MANGYQRPLTFEEFLREARAERVARVFRERGVQGLIEEGLIEDVPFEKAPGVPPLEAAKRIVRGIPALPAGAFTEPAIRAWSAGVTQTAQKFMPGEQDVERRIREKIQVGVPATEARIQVAQEGLGLPSGRLTLVPGVRGVPVGVQGFLEATTPIPLGGPIAAGAGKLAAPLVKPVVKAGLRGVKAIPGAAERYVGRAIETGGVSAGIPAPARVTAARAAPGEGKGFFIRISKGAKTGEVPKRYEEVVGKRIIVPGFEDIDVFLHRKAKGGNWTVSEGKTGLLLDDGAYQQGFRTQAEARASVTAKLGKIGKPETNRVIAAGIEREGLSPRYAVEKPSAVPEAPLAAGQAETPIAKAAAKAAEPWVFHRTTKAALPDILNDGMTTGDFTAGKAIDFPGDVTIRVRISDIPEGQVGDYGGAKWYLPGYETGGAIPAEKIEVQIGRKWVSLADYPDLAKPTVPVQQVAPELPIPGIREPTEAVVPPTAAEVPPVKPPVPPVAEAVVPSPLFPRPARQPNLQAGARAQPLPERVTPPPGNLPPSPTTEFPSGRVPGGIGRQTPTPPVDNFQLAVEALTPSKEPLTIKRARNAVLRASYWDAYDLRDLSRRTEVPVDKLAQLVPGATAAGEDIIRTNFRPVWEPIRKDVRYLEQYMMLKRNEDILQTRPHAYLPGGVQGAPGNTAAMKVLRGKLGPERFAAVEQTAEQLWLQHRESVLGTYLKEGGIDKAAYNAMVAEHPHYFPFMRDDFVTDMASIRGRPVASVATTGIKTMGERGSERALSEPFVRFEAQVIQAQAFASRQKAARALVEALTKEGETIGAELVRYPDPNVLTSSMQKAGGLRLPVRPAEHSKLWDTVSYFRDGEEITVEVPTIFAKIAKGLEREPENLLSTALRWTTAPLRLGAVTWNPAWLPVNSIYNATTALFREKLIPFSPDYIKGWVGAITKNADYQDAARAGTLMSGIIDTMRSTSAVSRVKRLGVIQVNNPLDALLVLPRLIEKVGLISEEATRVAVFRKLRAQGLPELEAAWRARDVTVDFSKAGNVGRVINQVVPFSNAAIQGSANIIRTMRDRPVWAAVIAGAFAAPTVMSRVNNMRFETSKEIPDYEYTRNWVVQYGEGTKKDGTKFPIYAKIPKGPVAGPLTFPIEALFSFARENEDRSAAELLLDYGVEAAKVISPVDVGWTGLFPPVAETAAGVATGVDPWSGQPIVPRKEEALLPEQQFGPDTSQWAVAVGEMFKVSPRKIDYAVRSYTAGVGQAVSWVLGMGLEALGYSPEPYGAAMQPELTAAEQISRTPVVSRFMGTRATQTERRGWEAFDKASEETNRGFTKLPLVNELGVRLGEVGTSFDMTPGVPRDSIELTPSQRARYQREMAAVVLPGLREYLDTYIIPPEYSGLSSETQRLYIQTAITSLKTKSAAAFRSKLLKEGVTAKRTPAPSKGATSAPTPGLSFSERADIAEEKLPVGAR